MARKVTIELTSDEDIKLRGSLEDIKDGADTLVVIGTSDGLVHDELEDAKESLDRARKIGENILLFLEVIQDVLGH